MHTTNRLRSCPPRHFTAAALRRTAPVAAGLALLLSFATMAQDQGASRAAQAEREQARREAGQIADRAAAQFEAQRPPPWSPAERRFMQAALAGSRFGEEAGRIGLRRATDPAVKNVAQKLAAGHATLARQIEQLAQSRGQALDAAPSAAQRQALERLRAAGGDFDTVFVRTAGVEAQQQAVQLFEKARADSGDTQLQQWIDTQLQALREPLSDAQRIPLRHAPDRPQNSSNNHDTPGQRP